MQDGNWKRRWQRRCHVKERWLKPAIGKPLHQKVQKPKHLKQRQDSVVLPNRKILQDQEPNRSRREVMKTILRWNDKIQYCITKWRTSFSIAVGKKPRAKRRSFRRNWKTTIKFTLHHWYTHVIQRMRRTNSRTTKDVLFTRVTEVERQSENQNNSLMHMPCFPSGAGVYNHTRGTCSHNGMIDYPRFPISKMHLRKIPWLYGIPKLQNELQDWRLLKNSGSSYHNAADQRSWHSKVNRRSCDVAIECGTNWFPRWRYAWWDDCVCIEEASRQSRSLPEKIVCGRAACSKIR